MTTPFHYSNSYVLDKSHFSETFDESVSTKKSIRAYAKSISLAILGIGVLYVSDIFPYAGWFIIALSGVDALSVYFQKPWWLARQMISNAANTSLTFTMDENGVGSQSHSVKSHISWEEIKKIEQTKQGWLLYTSSGRSYLSSRILSEEAIHFITTKAKSKKQ